LQEIVKVLKQSEESQKRVSDSVNNLVSEASSLGSVYSRISTEQLKQSELTASINSSITSQLDSNTRISGQNEVARKQANDVLSAYADQASIAAQMAQLTSDDVEKKIELQSEFDTLNELITEQLDSMDKRLAVTQSFMDMQDDIQKSVETQIKDAQELSSLTSEQKDILEEQAATFDSMKKKVDSIGSSLTTFLKRPQAAIGGLIIGAGVLVDKFADVNKELGNGFDILNSTTASAGLLGFAFDDTAGTVKALSSEFGDVEAASFKTQASIGLMATNMGVTNTEAVSLVGSFSRLNQGSVGIAKDLVKSTQEFAKQNGIIPSTLMADLAGSAEEFALFGKDGGKNILEAAGYAAKLGTNMNTVSGIADNLLDFESSITKELELGALLGKNINLNKARELAYAGDLDGMMKETLNALGGIQAFNDMDYHSKKATADLLGVSVAELQKMAANQEKANTLGGQINSKFSMVGETINAGLNKYLGTGLKGLGGMITMTGRVGTGFAAMGTSIGGVVKGTAQVLKNLLGMVAGPVLKGLKSVGGAIGSSGLGQKVGGLKDKLLAGVGSKAMDGGVAENAAKATQTGSKVSGGAKVGESLKGLAGGLKEMGTGKVLFGALNLIPAALGFVAILPGLPGMGGVSLLGTPAGTGLSALATGLSSLGTPQVLLGTANLALAAIGFTLMTLGSIGLAAIALGGIPAGAGLTALAGGLSAFGASAAVSIIGIGLLAAFGLALIPLTYGLSLLSPLIESFGNVITNVLGGVSEVITSVSSGLVNMLEVITLEKAASMLALAGAFPLLAAGIVTLGVAAFLGGGRVVKFFEDISESAAALSGGTADSIQTTASALVSMGSGLMMVNQQLDKLSVEKLDALSDFSMKLSIGGAVSAIGEGIGGLLDSVAGVVGGDKEDDSTTLLLDEMKLLRKDLTSGKIAVYMDGEKVTKRIESVVDKVGSNSYSK
jgi:hypothetical protein